MFVFEALLIDIDRQRVFPVRLHHDYCDEGVLQDESGAMSLAGISVLLVSLCTDHTIPRPSMPGGLRWITHLNVSTHFLYS